MLEGEGVVVVLVVLEPDEEAEPDGRLAPELDPPLELEERVGELDGDRLLGDELFFGVVPVFVELVRRT